MKNIIEEIFFFLHEQIEKLNSIFSSKISPLILAPLLPFSVVIISIIQLSGGVFILFNSIVIFIGIIFTFLLGASSFYFYKNENIYTIIKRKKSNKNLSQFKSNSNICISVFHHTAVILAITSLSNIFSPKYLLFNLYTNSSR